MPHVPLYVSEKFEGKSGAGLYGDVMQEIDWSVGEVMKALERAGVADNTWLIFTSDNGPWLSYGEHAGSAGSLRVGKGTSWEGGTRVPCLMRWPGKIPAGSESATMLMTIDLLPTIAGRIEAKLPERTIDGLDVWPVVSADGKNPHTGYATWYASNELQSVTDGRWKLVLPHGYRSLGNQPKAIGGIPRKYSQLRVAQPQLYDLRNDGGEQNDLATAQPEITERLTKMALDFRRDLGDSLTKTPASTARAPGRIPKG
jgi:arylsulfatase